MLHAAGPRNTVPPPELPAGGPPYVLLPYLDRMELAYAAADLALCRSGAITCAELTAVGLPAAYVPLPHGNGEQRLLAEPVVAAGGGLLVDDAACTPEWVAATLLPLLPDPAGWRRWPRRPPRSGTGTPTSRWPRLVLEAGGGAA